MDIFFGRQHRHEHETKIHAKKIDALVLVLDVMTFQKRDPTVHLLKSAPRQKFSPPFR